MSPWTGEFLDPGMEESYLLDAWPRLGRQIRLVLSFAGVLYLGALYLDYAKLGNTTSFHTLVLLRLGVGGLLVASVRAASRPGLPFRWLMVGSMLSIGVTELVERRLLHADPGGLGDLPFILVIILMAYVMVPNRVRLTFSASTAISLLFLGHQALEQGWNAPSTVLMLLYLIMANGTGYLFQLSWNRITRRDFALRLELEHEVTERKRAEDAARRADAAKSRFLAVMSHEIRTPLNGVLGGVQLLQETALQEAQRQPLEIVAHSGDQLARLLDDILDLARIEADRVDLLEEPFALVELLASVQAVIYPQAKAKGLVLRLEHPECLPEVLMGDALRLRQILINLAGNAVKFTERGEVVIGVELTPSPGKCGEVRCTFSVRDTGAGLDAEAQVRVFEPFEQGDGSIRRKQGGTGLGLTISRELVAAMGGELRLVSELGAGSIFRFALELRMGAVRNIPAPEILPMRPLSLLVVDDLDANRIVACGLLNSLGHQAYEARGGHEALALLEKMHVDAVLLDLHMPDMDGLETFRRMQALPRVPDVFLVTADTERAFLQTCLEAGIRGVIAKPIRKERLKSQLAGLVLPEEEPPGGDVPLVDYSRVALTLADLGPAVWREGVAACRASAQACMENLDGRTLHQLAGLSASYAMPKLYQAVCEAQNQKSPSKEGLHSLVALSLAELEATLTPDALPNGESS